MSVIYNLHKGEIITDVCNNASGSISVWEKILNDNSFTDWNTDLSGLNALTVEGVVSSIFQSELKTKPVNNNLYPDTLILTDILNGSVIESQILPENNLPVFIGYIVRPIEEIRDVLLNSTGTIVNWENILNDNDFTDWNPELNLSQQIIVDSSNQIQPNTLSYFNISPANNNSGISDFETQVTDLFSNFTTHGLFDPDGNRIMFEDGNLLIFN